MSASAQASVPAGYTPYTVEATGLPAWAQGRVLTAPTHAMRDGKLRAQELCEQDIEALRLSRVWIERAPASSRLPIPYHIIPPRLRMVLAGIMGKRKKHALENLFPRFPVDLSADALSDAMSLANPLSRFEKPPFITTHDIDSEEGLDHLLRYFLPIEERYGLRSVNYIVPCKWKLDHGKLNEIAQRGHQLGIHGYNHANKTPFLPEAELTARVEAARPLVERYGMTGYRAPSLCRTPALIRALKKLYRYDSSVPTTGGLFPVAGNGCASARPFTLEGMPEVPLSLPRDGHLRFLGHSAEEILTIWKNQAEYLRASHGLTHLLTHCESHFTGNPPMLKAYEAFLAHIVERQAWTPAFPDEVL